MIRWRGAGNIDFTAICGVPYALLDQQLLKCRELFGGGLIADGLPGIHRSDLADHRFDPRIMCRNVDDVAPTKARAPYAKSIAVHFRLQRKPRQSTPVIFHLIAREDALTRLAAARAKEAIVK